MARNHARHMPKITVFTVIVILLFVSLLICVSADCSKLSAEYFNATQVAKLSCFLSDSAICSW